MAMTPRRDRGARSYRAGLRAEGMAVWLLRLKGYRILARRYKTPVGEIDIVARRFGRLAFIEVKARAAEAAAHDAVTARMRGRIRQAAEHFLSRFPDMAALRMGFDLIAVTPPCFLRHVPDAWRDE